MWEKRKNGSEDEGLKKNRNFNRAIQAQNNNSDGTLHVPTCIPRYIHTHTATHCFVGAAFDLLGAV